MVPNRMDCRDVREDLAIACDLAHLKYRFRLKKFAPLAAQYKVCEFLRLSNRMFNIIKWLITLILCFSGGVDVTITATLSFLLFIKRRRYLRVGNQVVLLTNLDGVIDSLIIYTLELGSLTGCDIQSPRYTPRLNL